MFFNSLSLLFAFTSFIGWLDLVLVAAAMVLAIYLLTPEPMIEWQERQPTSLYYYLQWSWLGYLRLKDAFWPFFLLFNAVLLYIDYRIEENTFTVASWVTMHMILLMPLIYWTGAVWRCSDNCSNKLWAVAARWLTVAAYGELIFRYVIYQYYPNILFSCQQMIIQWGDCI